MFRRLRHVIVLAAALIGITITGADVRANCPSLPSTFNQGWLFRYPSNVVVLDFTSTFAGAIELAQSDYNSNSNISVVDGPTGDFLGDYHNVRNEEYNFGKVGLAAYVEAFDNLVPCVTELAGSAWVRTCGFTESTTADYAIVNFNSDPDVAPWFTQICRHPPNQATCVTTFRERTVKHEWAHVLGVNHPDNDGSSCGSGPSVVLPVHKWMGPFNCEYYDMLQDWELNLLECWY